MAKERNYNPVQAQRKAEKAKAIKKGKADVQARRNERLAKRNPEGIKRQIDDLKAVTSSGGKLTSHEEQVLEGLEKELKAVTKAREALGDKAPTFSNSGRGPPRDGEGGNGVLGKRRRGWEDRRDGGANESSDSEDVPEDVKSIPMPRDTPPPIPKEVMDKWYARRRARRGDTSGGTKSSGGSGTNANLEPLINDRGIGGRDGRDSTRTDPNKKRDARAAAPTSTTEPQIVYEAKPVVRDLVKEAASAFVPAAVRNKMAKGKGQAGLLEPEEADRLELEGYLEITTAAGVGSASEGPHATRAGDESSRKVTMEDVDDDEDG